MLKVSENPPIIWPQVESIRDFEGQWWVVIPEAEMKRHWPMI